MDSEPKFWLPAMPKKTDIEKMISRLHPILIETISLGCRNAEILKSIRRLQPQELILDLKARFPEDGPSPSSTEDSYNGCELQGRPVFSVEGWYKPAKKKYRTDILNVWTTFDVEPRAVAEAISQLKEKHRARVADLLIATYLEENESLYDLIATEEAIEDGTDETADLLDYDEYIEQENDMQEIYALMDVRVEIVAGTFGVLPSTQTAYGTDLLQKKFENELKERAFGKYRKKKKRDK